MTLEELAEMPDSEYRAWLKLASRDGIAGILADWHAEQLIDYKAQELRECLQDAAVNGVLGYSQMSLRRLKRDLDDEVRGARV